MTKEIMQRVLGIVFLLACLLGGIALLLSHSQKDSQAKHQAMMPPTSITAPVVLETKKSEDPALAPAATAVVVLKEVKKDPSHQDFTLNPPPSSPLTASAPDAKAVSEPTLSITKPVPVQKKAQPIVIHSPAKKPLQTKAVAKSNKSRASAGWLLQIASFTQRQSAEQLLRQAPKRLGVFHIEKASVGRGVRYRVTLGPFADRERAMQARASLGQPYSTRAIVVHGG